MPAPQLHLTFGDLVQHNTHLPVAMRRACAKEPAYTRFGAIFHDLPYYYGPMVFEAVRYGLGAPALDEPWGYRLHSVHPDRLVASFVAAARTTPGLSTDERLALVGGLLSHAAIDLAMHPLVNYCARRDVLRHGGHESTHHRLTEKYHALFIHLWRLGDDQIGTPAFAERCRITKRGNSLSLKIEQPILDLVTTAFGAAYGSSPSQLQFSKWVRNFRQFGLLLSTPWVAKNSQRTRTDAMRERYFVNAEFDTRDFFAAAERRLVHLGGLSFDYFENGDFSDSAQSAYLARAGIDDLAEPQPVDLPSIPYLLPVRGKIQQPKAARPPRLRLPQMRLRRKKNATASASMS
jgi:hypothetical protein